MVEEASEKPVPSRTVLGAGALPALTAQTVPGAGALPARTAQTVPGAGALPARTPLQSAQLIQPSQQVHHTLGEGKS